MKKNNWIVRFATVCRACRVSELDFRNVLLENDGWCLRLQRLDSMQRMPYAYHPIWNGKVLGLAHSGLHQTLLLLYIDSFETWCPAGDRYKLRIGPISAHLIDSTSFYILFYFICLLSFDSQYTIYIYTYYFQLNRFIRNCLSFCW